MNKKYPFNMTDFMRALKPVKTCNFMDMCANYLTDCKKSYDDDEQSYEIRGFYTKSGNPVTIYNK